MVLVVKNLLANPGDSSFYAWVREIPWRRKWQPVPAFLPGKFHGQRSLEGYNPWGLRELDPTEWLSPCVRAYTHTHVHRTLY